MRPRVPLEPSCRLESGWSPGERRKKSFRAHWRTAARKTFFSSLHATSTSKLVRPAFPLSERPAGAGVRAGRHRTMAASAYEDVDLRRRGSSTGAISNGEASFGESTPARRGSSRRQASLVRITSVSSTGSGPYLPRISFRMDGPVATEDPDDALRDSMKEVQLSAPRRSLSIVVQRRPLLQSDSLTTTTVTVDVRRLLKWLFACIVVYALLFAVRGNLRAAPSQEFRGQVNKASSKPIKLRRQERVARGHTQPQKETRKLASSRACKPWCGVTTCDLKECRDCSECSKGDEGQLSDEVPAAIGPSPSPRSARLCGVVQNISSTERPPWDWTGDLPKRTLTHCTANGHAIILQPLPRAELSIPSSLRWQQPIEKSVAAWDPRWAAVSQRLATQSRLNVAIVGVSPTSGCGASEPWNASAGERRSPICDITRSWGRRVHDELETVLSRALDERIEVRLSISFKNAASACSFALCTEAHVPADADLVLIEVACNLWCESLSPLIQSIRRVAPRAAVAFIVWENMEHTSSKDAKFKNAVPAPALIRMAATTEQADIMSLRPTMQSLVADGTPLKFFYANGGADKVHPSPIAHAIIAAASARFICKRLVDELCSGQPNGSLVVPEVAPREPTGKPWEVCFTKPSFTKAGIRGAWPLSGSIDGTSWRFVDDGKAKRVAKVGIESTRVGETLRLGPLPSPPSRANCTWIQATLGYLSSYVRPGFGAFEIECSGCECFMNQVYKPLQYLHPFPHVETGSRHLGNVTVSASTTFNLIVHPGMACELHITHRRRACSTKGRKSKCPEDEPSRIRIDSLALQETPAGAAVRRARKSLNASLLAQHFHLDAQCS